MGARVTRHVRTERRYLGDRVSEEQHPRPGQRSPAARRLAQRHIAASREAGPGRISGAGRAAGGGAARGAGGWLRRGSVARGVTARRAPGAAGLNPFSDRPCAGRCPVERSFLSVSQSDSLLVVRPVRRGAPAALCPRERAVPPGGAAWARTSPRPGWGPEGGVAWRRPQSQCRPHAGPEVSAKGPRVETVGKCFRAARSPHGRLVQ